MAQVRVVEMLDGTVGVMQPNWRKLTLDPVEAAAGGKQLIEDLDDWFVGEMMKMPDVVGPQPYHTQKVAGQDDFCDSPAKWLTENIGHPLHAVVLVAKRVADARPNLTVEANSLPYEGSFKGAREFDPIAGVAMNMTKARTIRLTGIREERNARLVNEDANYMIADEIGDVVEKAAVVARKQALRDLPTTSQSDLDAIEDVAALDMYSPTWPE